jgi:ABC-type uncharacterized transport system permease subunit
VAFCFRLLQYLAALIFIIIASKSEVGTDRRAVGSDPRRARRSRPTRKPFRIFESELI